MEPSEYKIWVDDHNIDDDGHIVALVRHARAGDDPQVGKVFMVGDGEQTPFAAIVIERTPEGRVILRAEDHSPMLHVIAGQGGPPGPSTT